MHLCIAWDKVDNPSPQSTPHVLSSFEEYTPPVTYPEEVDKTIGIPMEVKPLEHTKREDLRLNTCSHDLFPSSREFPSMDESEPQPLTNLPFLDVNLRGKKGTDPPINLYSLGSFRMKAFGRITRDLGSFGEETDKTTDLHQNFSRLCSQRLETVSQDTRDAVIIQPMTASEIWRRGQNMDDLKEL
ncbi:hypothetical protein Tco_0607849 [Tanacetum coccineum]